MAAFPKMTLTNVGQALQTKVLAGAELTFTRIALGDGKLNGQPISPLTALIHQTASVSVDTVVVINDDTCQASGFFTNKDISTGFWWREFGIFAQDPDVGEILYGYTNAGDAGDYIPPVQDTRIEKYIFCSIAVANAETVNITIPSSDTFIPLAQKGAPGGVATLGADGKIPAVQIPSVSAQTVTYDNSTSGMRSTNVQEAVDELKADIDNAAATAKFIQIMLLKSAWSALTQTVTVQGVLADETQQQITPTPSLASQQEYYTAEVMVTAQAENSLTFTCAQTPASDLTVYVVVMGVTTA